jgi:GMC oxidoreductase
MGRILGGGSSVNAMIWARGHKNDWDFFAAEARDSAWNFQDHILVSSVWDSPRETMEVKQPFSGRAAAASQRPTSRCCRLSFRSSPRRTRTTGHRQAHGLTALAWFALRAVDRFASRVPTRSTRFRLTPTLSMILPTSKPWPKGVELCREIGIRRLGGQGSRWLKPFLKTPHRVTCCEIGTKSTGVIFAKESEA